MDNATATDGVDSTVVKEKEPPPATVGEEVFRAAVRTLDYRTTDEDGVSQPIVPQPADRESWEQGARVAIDKMASMYPPEDPAAFALGQLWLFLRAVGDQINVLTNATAAMQRDVAGIVAKVEEYAEVLPDPDSLLAKAGRWGTKRRPVQTDG